MRQTLFDLSGKTALVTGSSRGLGYVMARELARSGARIVLNGVDPTRLASAQAQLKAEGIEAETLAFDVTQEASVVAAFAELDKKGIAINILINNAGIQMRKPLLDFALDDWNKVIATNLTSAFIMGREAARRMVARGFGKIINIGSLASELARPTTAPYASAKGGIKMLTRAMAVEWAQNGVQVNGIGPGYMLTDMNQALMSDAHFNNWLMSRVPAKRWGQPEELAGTAVFLASSASDYINGQMIYVDGGMLAAM
ncbi:MAG: SDR family oxidoreductase [Hyphomicrobiales bacterium]|nr:SDR family oxidoreductase [Hyphomicrobiales bacterium]MDE2116034.1 SDR family oxidoreductase [Hyphomicrobiales bacterium]